MRSSSSWGKVQLVLTFRLAFDDRPGDSGSFCARVVAKFSDDRH